MSGPGAERPGLAPARTASKDERTVSLSNDVGTEPEPFGNPRTKAFNENVRTIEQIEELFKAGGGLDVQLLGPLTTGKELDTLMAAVGHTVDTNDVGAHIGKEHGAEGRRTDPSGLDDSYTRQWSRPVSPTNSGIQNAAQIEIDRRGASKWPPGISA